jgi:hypothetical protein
MISISRSCCFVIAVFVVGLQGCSSGNAPIISRPVEGSPPLKASMPLSTTVDLGVVTQGQSAALKTWIKNQSDHAVQVSRIESSCECLDVRLSPMTIEPGKRALVRCHYDGAREPDFVGSLHIEVQLTDDKGMKIGQIDVPIEVILAKNNED